MSSQSLPGITGFTVRAADGEEPAAGRSEAVSITACPGGPLLVRGDFEILDADDALVRKNRETVALCRCGGSKIKPWCDGTHKLLKRSSVPE